MPLGNLDIKMKLGGEKAKNYRRGLDLETAVAFTEFSVGEAKYKREVFASEPDSIIAVHITSENGLINLSAGLDGRDDYYDDNRPVKKTSYFIPEAPADAAASSLRRRFPPYRRTEKYIRKETDL